MILVRQATKNRSLKRRGLVLLCLLLIASSAFSSAVYGAEGEEGRLTAGEIALVESIDYDAVYGHVKYISDEIGIRVAGGPAEKRGADYLAGVLDRLGYEPWYPATGADGVDDYFQTIEGDARVTPIIGSSVTIEGREYPANGPNWSESSIYKGYETPEVTGDTVYFPSIEEAVTADVSEIEDKIVLTHRDGTGFADDVRVLEEKGALAVVYFYNKYTVAATGKTSAESRFAAPTTGDEINIPVILTSYFDGELILDALTHHGEVNSAEATVANRRNTTTQNVIAIKEAAEPSDEYVIIGAHYDSVFGAKGANDNLSGVAAVLGIAEAFTDVDTEHNVIFAFWGAEEVGLRGSTYFYDTTLVADDYYDSVIAYYNIDMAAASQKNNDKLTIHTPYRNSDNTPHKSTAGEIFEEKAAGYWTYSDGRWEDWWSEGVDLAFYGNCSDHAGVSGANQGHPLETALSQVYVFWGGPGVVEYNNHVVGDRYDWPGDSFTLKDEEEDYAGNFSIEREEIITSIFALSLYESAGGSKDDNGGGQVGGSVSIGVSVGDYGRIGGPVEFTFSLENADQVSSIEFEFTIDAANITSDLTGLTALNGFTALPARNGTDTIDWTHLEGTLWKGEVTLIYPSNEGFTSEEAKDILKVVREAGQLGDVTLNLNRATVTQLRQNELINGELSPKEATISITETFVLWDLNRDGKVDQLDLNVALAYYQASSENSNWDEIDSYGYKPSQADVSGDGIVNLVDLVDIFIHYTY